MTAQESVMIRRSFLEKLQECFHLVPKKERVVMANSEFIDLVFVFVCRYRGHDPEQAKKKIRDNELVETRYITSYIIKKLCAAAPLALIGKRIGGKNHATILHGIRITTDRYEVDKNYRKYIEELMGQFQFEHGIRVDDSDKLITNLIVG